MVVTKNYLSLFSRATLFTFLTLLTTLSIQATTFTVTKVADTNDGVCDSDCSIREAISQANNDSTDDIINFDQSVFSSPSTITLNGTELSVQNSGTLRIEGLSDNFITVSGNNLSRVFIVNPEAQLSINYLTIIEGNGVGNTSTSEGGGLFILFNAVVNIKNSTIRNNSASSTGGGIFSIGKLTVTNSLIYDNSVPNGGGGISAAVGTLEVNQTHIFDNNVSNNAGGGISISNDCEAIISNSTINGNFTAGKGGGIFNSSSILTVSNSTIHNNTAGNGGGGVSNFGTNSTTVLINSTVSENTTNAEGGGGVLNTPNGITRAKNTIFADNIDLTNTSPDFGGSLTSEGFNVIENSSNTIINGDTTGNIIGQDPLLGTLQDNGGWTPTQALSAGSPAIDSGNSNDFEQSDQRGVLRPLDGDMNGSVLPDIGAFEAGAKIVNTVLDTRDGVCDADCSLRDAINEANNSTFDDAIVFSSLFNSPKTISTVWGEIKILSNGKLSIHGKGTDLLTIDSNHISRALSLDSNTDVFLEQMAIIRGNGIGSFGSGGGCIRNTSGVLTIQDSNISGCFAGGGTSGARGGAIFNGGILKLENSSVISNFSVVEGSGGNGGGIFNDIGSNFELIDSLIFANSAEQQNGGGIYNAADVISIIINSNITNNVSAGGSGIYNAGEEMTVENTVFNNNTLPNNINNGAGGGISNISGILTINDSAFASNVGSSGGGVTMDGNSNTTINNTSFIGNSATRGNGGAIANAGTLNASKLIIMNNSAVAGTNFSGGKGGGIVNGGTTTLDNLTIENNTAKDGGGISNNASNLIIKNSTIANNVTTGQGGGAYCERNGNVTFMNSTLSNNRSDNVGGGIRNVDGNVINLVSSTISNNSADLFGGVANNFLGTINSTNSIIANNSDDTTNSNSAPDFAGTLTSQGYNLIENINNTVIEGDTSGNILGLDPQLLPLGDYGGTTKTHALQPTSPAIDSADPKNFPKTDQRGIPRPQDGNLDNTPVSDIGAYERDLTTFTVSKISDTNDGNCNSDCSLREAIEAANNATSLDNAVIFDTSVFSTPQTITLTSGELELGNNGTLILNGASAELLKISGNNQSRVLSIATGAFATLSNVTIADGNGVGSIQSGFGGGIINNGGTLGLANSIVANNSTANSGGGIYIDNNGSLQANNSKLINNSATENGGGIFLANGNGFFLNSTFAENSANSGGAIGNNGNLIISKSTVNDNTANLGGGGVLNSLALTMTNSTVSGNSIAGSFGGGGIFNNSTGVLNLINSTIANNSGNNGGGIRNNDGNLNSMNSIIADNTDTNNTAPDFSGILNSNGFNLIENTTNTTIIGDMTTNILNVDPELLPLSDNGGLTLTHSFVNSSPLIDAGNSSNTNSDQRDFIRPFDNPDINNSPNVSDGADIGAVELQESEFTSGSAPFDFDGDGKTDVSIFRPNLGQWWYLRSSDFSNAAFAFGTNTDTLVPADYTGDGKTDIAFWRESTGEWFILRSEDSSFYSVPFGTAGDIPAPGDFDGDGIADTTVYRPSETTWYIQRSSDNGTTITPFGVAEDLPTVADFDGDGKDDIAIYRPSVSQWWQFRSQDGVIAYQFGTSGDKTIQGDYTGDGKADVGVFRPSTGQWLILRSEDSSFFGFPFGVATDIPSPGDYDGDGTFDAAVFRPSTNTWFYNGSTSGNIQLNFGVTGDIPIPNVYSQE